MTGLAPIDGWAVAAILVKTLEYGTALLALGGPLFLVTIQSAPDSALRVARTVAIGAAALCLCLLALRFGIRSARISGMGMSGMADPVMLGLIWHSPLGSAALLRGLGAVLVLTLAARGGLFQVAALIGSVLIAVSYTQVGHALGDPRWLLAGVLALHLLAVGFWVAALAPLYHVTGTPGGSELLHRFG